MLTEGLSQTTKNVKSGMPVSGPMFEPGTSRIRSRCVNHSNTNFGALTFEGWFTVKAANVTFAETLECLEQYISYSAVLQRRVIFRMHF
jgi:hypothetical protein